MKRFRHLQTLIQRFWNKWSSEYLTELRERHKNCDKEPVRRIKSGEIILIKEDKLPKSRWRMGKVEKLCIGRDNRVRRCLLKVVSKISLVKLVNRPIEKLCPLEIRTEQLEDNSNTIYKQGLRPKEKQLLKGF